jgi:hypothetical protein
MESGMGGTRMAVRLKVKLKLQTPLLAVGTLRAENNFFSSLDYLPGGVLRAALAAALLETSNFDRSSYFRHNWVTLLNDEERRQCLYPHLFDEFSEMRINDATLHGSRFAPMTAYKCKSNSDHAIFDCLTDMLDEKYERRCPTCQEPVDRFSGWLLNGKEVSGIYRAVTRTAINPYLGVATDEKLFTCNCLETVCLIGEDEEPTELYAVIHCSQEAAAEWKTFFKKYPRIYAGRYTSSGMGAMDVEAEEDTTIEKTVEERLQLLKLPGAAAGYLRVLITTLSDSYLQLETTGCATKDCLRETVMKKNWAHALELPKEGSVVRCFTDYRLRSGFSTEQKGTMRRRSAKWVVTKGSVFVADLPERQASLEWLTGIEERGLGENTSHGFGRVVVADPIHMGEEREECVKSGIG